MHEYERTAINSCVSKEENPGTDYDGLLSYLGRLSRITGRLYNMSFTKTRVTSWSGSKIKWTGTKEWKSFSMRYWVAKLGPLLLSKTVELSWLPT
jgi:hypothetical protein